MPLSRKKKTISFDFIHNLRGHRFPNRKRSGIGSYTRKVTLAVLSGVMLTASFPPGRLSLFAWLALVPLLKSIENESPLKALKLGYIAGLSHYLSLIYWIVVVVGRYGGLNPFVSFSVFVLLCLYLALYPAFFSCLSVLIKGSRFRILFISALWISLEYLRAMLLTGFPWCLLGYSQYENLHIIQVADLFGVYGISFLIVTVNVFLYDLLFQRRNWGISIVIYEMVFAGLLTAATLIYGHCELSKRQSENDTDKNIAAVIVQGNIDQSVKWDPAYQAGTVATYKRLTLKAIHDFRPDLVVWPETSLPFFIQNNRDFSQDLHSLAVKSGSSFIVGSPAYKRINGRKNYFNRAYLISPDEYSFKYYDKVHLVPFGEYVPYKDILFFVDRLVPAAGDFQPGKKDMSPLRHNDLSLGILICFEAIFPDMARSYSRKGADMLINLTNDAWFGKTSAPYQHLSMAVLRAVENRMPLIRAANTGFSAFISPHGEIIERSALFREEVLKAGVKIVPAQITWYARTGDVFAVAFLVISLLKIILAIRQKQKTKG
ncbi:MAG TPA: apolipoprotein N-acyltransferase [Desulfobacteraceae bacterium]|nr:apolipoprotein N-acyltransferase [Desulfobacteraceae bacterium]